MAELIGSNITDLRFSLTPERVSSTNRQTYLDNFDTNGFVNSKTAMQNIAASSTVMGEVTSSSVAMGEVATTPLAMDEVASSSTAMDEVASSSTAMDEVALSSISRDSVVASATAMKSVSKYQTAMDKVVASSQFLTDVIRVETAKTLFHTSSHIETSYWTTSQSQQTWDIGTLDSNAGVTMKIGQNGDTLGNTTFNVPQNNGYAIGAILEYDNDGSGYGKWTSQFNFDYIDEIEITTENVQSRGLYLEVSVGGAQIAQISEQAQATHTISVQDTGIKKLELRFIDNSFDPGVAFQLGDLQFN